MVNIAPPMEGKALPSQMVNSGSGLTTSKAGIFFLAGLPLGPVWAPPSITKNGSEGSCKLTLHYVTLRYITLHTLHT